MAEERFKEFLERVKPHYELYQKMQPVLQVIDHAKNNGQSYVIFDTLDGDQIWELRKTGHTIEGFAKDDDSEVQIKVTWE